MNFEDFEIDDFEMEDFPYWCSHCDAPASKLLELPEPVETDIVIVSELCESCYNEHCNEALAAIRKGRLQGETTADWVERCNEVSEKYGFGADHKFCKRCWCPQPHEPDCIECGKEVY